MRTRRCETQPLACLTWHKWSKVLLVLGLPRGRHCGQCPAVERLFSGDDDRLGDAQFRVAVFSSKLEGRETTVLRHDLVSLAGRRNRLHAFLKAPVKCAVARSRAKHNSSTPYDVATETDVAVHQQRLFTSEQGGGSVCTW